jgi:hypothetical protein
MKRKIIIGAAVLAALMVLAVICFNAVDRGVKNAVEGITISVESAIENALQKGKVNNE